MGISTKPIDDACKRQAVALEPIHADDDWMSEDESIRSERDPGRLKALAMPAHARWGGGCVARMANHEQSDNTKQR